MAALLADARDKPGWDATFETAHDLRGVLIAGGPDDILAELEALRARGLDEVVLDLRLRMDAFEETLPVTLVATPEVVAAYGQAGAERASESLALPTGVVPGYGGLRIETASTALVGLGEGARYLVDYPFGCAEQRASAALALGLTVDLGQAFALDLPGDVAASARATDTVRRWTVVAALKGLLES